MKQLQILLIYTALLQLHIQITLLHKISLLLQEFFLNQYVKEIANIIMIHHKLWLAYPHQMSLLVLDLEYCQKNKNNCQIIKNSLKYLNSRRKNKRKEELNTLNIIIQIQEEIWLSGMIMFWTKLNNTSLIRLNQLVVLQLLLKLYKSLLMMLTQWMQPLIQLDYWHTLYQIYHKENTKLKLSLQVDLQLPCGLLILN